MIDMFWGDNDGWLSNFAYVPVMGDNDGISYPTVEHAYQAAKTLDLGARLQFSKIPTPGVAKYAGNSIQLREDWEAVKVDVMRWLLLQKFSVPYYKRLLLDTGDEFLKEGNHWHDNIWGDCLCKKCKKTVGKNILGQLLMDVRAGLRVAEARDGATG